MKITKAQLKQLIKEELEESRLTEGQIDIEPLGGAAQEVFSDAYYDLFDYLRTGPGQDLPGEKPSEKLKFALRWIAKFEQG
jgi:hypothetical protein